MKSVLVVEDDLDLRSTLEGTISDLGYLVVSASDGREALSVLRSGIRPQLILLDLMMPVLDGWKFREAQIADPHLRRIPTVIMSATRNLVNSDLDADELLPKPIRLDLLEETLQRYVGAPMPPMPLPTRDWRLVAPGPRESCRWQRDDGFWISIVIDGEAGRVYVKDGDGRCDPAISFEAALDVARQRRY